jgi:exonuclease SbcC
MISNIKITDFQPYEKVDIILHPGINCILGRNNSGKTAILRALRLVFFNRPEGAEFVRYGAKNTTVEISYNDNTIKRIKGKLNSYELNGSIYSSFGRDIPPEIINALGFSVIQVDRNIYELNYSSAHEAPFFVSETPAMAGKIFSKLGEHTLGDLVLLDKSINTANATVRKLNVEKTVISKQKTEIEEQLIQYEGVEELETELEECGSLLIDIKETDNREYLYQLKDSIIEHDKHIALYTSLCSINVEKIDKLLIDIKDLVSEKDKLITLNILMNSFLSNIESMESRQIPDSIYELDDKVQDIIMCNADIDKYGSLADNLNSLATKISRSEFTISKIDTELINLVGDYKNQLKQGKKCPVCFQDISEHTLDTILEEL